MCKYNSYLYETALRGIPVRCEVCDGIIWGHGLSPPITQQSGLVLIFVWKHPAWKWCRKQQVTHQATQANPSALKCVQTLAFINTNTLPCPTDTVLLKRGKDSISSFVHSCIVTWLQAKPLIGQTQQLTFQKRHIQYLHIKHGSVRVCRYFKYVCTSHWAPTLKPFQTCTSINSIKQHMTIEHKVYLLKEPYCKTQHVVYKK